MGDKDTSVEWYRCPNVESGARGVAGERVGENIAAMLVGYEEVGWTEVYRQWE